MVVLVNDEGQPLFLPNVYVTLRYRDVGSAATTIEKVLRSIGMAYLWLLLARSISIKHCPRKSFFRLSSAKTWPSSSGLIVLHKIKSWLSRLIHNPGRSLAWSKCGQVQALSRHEQ